METDGLPGMYLHVVSLSQEQCPCGRAHEGISEFVDLTGLYSPTDFPQIWDPFMFMCMRRDTMANR
jgi:hypothetical protein